MPSPVPAALVLAMVVVATAALVALLGRFTRWPPPHDVGLRATASAPPSALLVTAHPDDEAMFFAPTILALRRGGYRVRILCLSAGINGPTDGATTRADELRSAAARLGVAPGDVDVIDAPDLRDGMTTHWSASLVAGFVRRAVEADASTTRLVVTFDAGGVTGHVNHAAAHAGVAVYAAGDNAPPCYALATVAAARKFVGGPADVALSLAAHALTQVVAAPAAADPVAPRAGAPRLVTVVTTNPLAAHAALAAHASQYAWWRVLFVGFSRYTWVNSLALMNPPPPPPPPPALGRKAE